MVGSGVAGLLVVAYAWWAVARPPFSGTATVVVLTAGVTAVVGGGVARRRRWPDVEVRTAAVWAVLAVVAASWQLAAYVRHPRGDHPTLSSLANSLIDSQPARTAGFVAWVVAMIGLSRR